MWDQHTHCFFSGDSEANPEEMILSARKMGLSGICFTDHLDFDYREEPGLFLLDIPEYKKTILSLQEKYQETFPVHWGIELGLQPHLVEENKKVVAENPFDLVIGSTHCIDTVDIYYPHYYEKLTVEEAFFKFFEATLKNVETFPDFDVYGHLDYVVRYIPNQTEEFSYQKYSDIIDEILRQIILRGKGIEMNMAGFKYGLGHPNPTEAILKRYRELGGEIITVGSDGHKPEHVGYNFKDATGLLKEAGFDYYTIFRKRKAEFVKL